MKGFVSTPRETVDTMVGLLFHKRPLSPKCTVLDPGCGTGEFIDGVIRWCERRGFDLPQITGIESDPRHLPVLRAKYERLRAVRIEHADFLTDGCRTYDFIVGNPPYVAITQLSEDEKTQYRSRYSTARGRFDLYLLFFEQALRSLAPGGRLVFITPEKYLYVETAAPLRNMLVRYHLEQIRLVREDTFGELVTYPTITVLNNRSPAGTQFVRRDGTVVTLRIPPGLDSWLPLVEGAEPQRATAVLGDLCLRISCGVATGADSVFVRPVASLAMELRSFARPTISGRQLAPGMTDLPKRSAMLLPYDEDGRLMPLARLGTLGDYLMRADVRRRLLARTCVKRKPWYAFHETPPLREILRPKILCKDICETPHFWVEPSGQIVPRHSVYYIVPRDPGAIDVLAVYLRSSAAHKWLVQNCQRASKGYLRLQSRVLRRLPLPDEVVQAVTSSPRSTDANSPLSEMDFAFTG
jgi:SAM-dependent methyltransferase